MVDDSSEIFIIGGEQIYTISLSLATHLYITKVNANYKGDAFFPDFIQNDWREVGREDLISDSNLNFSFLKYEKIN